MGRRAADLTTPVPVLGVPALVGVRAWKTTEGDRRGAALQHAWGFQCNVAVQTSPGTSRATTCLTDALLGTLTLTSSSSFNNVAQCKEPSLLTKDDSEKKAILKQKSGESKAKKEVSFKALRHEGSGDVAHQSASAGAPCYARAIKTNPHVAGHTGSAKAKFKSAKRYINGSVVDSEAVGGISVENHEREPVKAAGCYEEVQSNHIYENEPKQIQSWPASRPISQSQKICNNCGGKQTARLGATSVGDSRLGKTCLTPAFATLPENQHFPVSQIKDNLKINTQRVTHTLHNRQRLSLLGELRHQKTPHPACPVHSRENPVSVPHPTPSASVRASPFPHAKTITVTKATIEPRHNEHKGKDFTKLALVSNVTVSPRRATATKTKEMQSHTYPRQLKPVDEDSPQCNLQTNMCVSVQAAPVNKQSPLYPQRKTLSINTKQDTFNSSQSAGYACIASAKDETLISNRTLQKNFSFKQSPFKYSKNTRTSVSAENQMENANKSLMSENQVTGDQMNEIKTSPCSKSYSDAVAGSTATLKSVASQNTLNTEAVSKQNQTNHEFVPLRVSEPKVFVSTPSLFTASNRSKAMNLKTEVSRNVALRDTSQVKIPAFPLVSEKQDNHSASSAAFSASAHTNQVAKAANNRAQTREELGSVSNQENHLYSSLLHISETQTLCRENDISEDRINYSKSENDIRSKKDKINDVCMKKSVLRELKDPGNPSLSQASNLENYISIIKSRSTCLQGCMNTRQHKLECNQGCIKEDVRRQFKTCPRTSVTGSSTESDMAVGHSRVELKPNKQSELFLSEQTNRDPVTSDEEKPIKTPSNQTSDFITSPLPHVVPHLSLPPSNLLNTKRYFCAQEGPQSNTLTPSSTTHSASHHSFQSSEAQAVIKPDLYPSPALPQLCPEETCLAHSHPSDAGLLLPPSPQCSKSAALQRRLETVEASLAANKERITTLLNIIHDLEICRSPSSSRCFESGKHFTSCLSCQRTACIVYSVEYDFRQQERRFLEILNCAASGDHFLTTQHSQQSNFGQLRNVVMKRMAKTKVKSKKLCKTLFRWLPRKTLRE